MADTTITQKPQPTPTAPVAPTKEEASPSAPKRHVLRNGMVVGALALGGVGVVLAVSGSDDTPARRPVTSVAPAQLTGGDRVSADAAERRAESQRQAQIEACTSAAYSADALERCMATEATSTATGGGAWLR